MKTLILSSVLTIISFGIFAQSDTTLQKSNYTLKNIGQDGYITMKDGKTMILKNGKMTEMTSETILTDGTRVTTTGKIIRTDGTTYMLKEGEKISLSGELIDSRQNKSK